MNRVMTAKFCLLAGALVCLLSVVFGAFGAHALKSLITAKSMAVFDTALRYQMFHGMALLVLGLLMNSTQPMRVSLSRYAKAGALFLLGLLLFCGSLYALALSGIKVLGVITPFGGLAFIVGWVYLILALLGIDKNGRQ